MTSVASVREEIASALTHGLGAVLALAASAVLITLAAIYGDGWQLASAIVFGIALLLLYTASTLYHAIQHPQAKGRLKVFDHCAIYVLIAGTYTPFTLIGLRGPWGWGMFTAIWALALGGVVFKLFYTGRFKLLSTVIYIAMGWLVVVARGLFLDVMDVDASQYASMAMEMSQNGSAGQTLHPATVSIKWPAPALLPCWRHSCQCWSLHWLA